MFYDLATSNTEHFTVTEPGQHVFFVYNKSCDLQVTLAVPGVDVYIFGLFVGKGADKFTVHTTQHHAVGRTTSNLLIKGVFDDQSKFVYEGLIRIEKGADGSHAYQKNQNLMLSEKAFVDSRPFLEILANDVFCTHGSTTGRINRDQLEYARTRGLTFDRAKKLLVEGFINDLFLQVEGLGAGEELERYRAKYMIAGD